MLHQLQRHPFPVTTFFRRSLVLTYAFPSDLLRPLLPPGLVLDTFGDLGFLAVALVQARRLRPAFLPACLGRDCFLAGFRLFVRLEGGSRSLRGLWIVESYTDQRWMLLAGNLLTRYRYRLCHANVDNCGTWSMRTPQGRADLTVHVRSAAETAALPCGSPFGTIHEARRFAGPLPYTFDYEPETRSVIRIRGVRPHWSPRPVAVEVGRNAFLDRQPFCRVQPVLANAFEVTDLPYRWEHGVRMPLPSDGRLSLSSTLEAR